VTIPFAAPGTSLLPPFRFVFFSPINLSPPFGCFQVFKDLISAIPGVKSALAFLRVYEISLASPPRHGTGRSPETYPSVPVFFDYWWLSVVAGRYTFAVLAFPPRMPFVFPRYSPSFFHEGPGWIFRNTASVFLLCRLWTAILPSFFSTHKLMLFFLVLCRSVSGVLTSFSPPQQLAVGSRLPLPLALFLFSQREGRPVFPSLFVPLKFDPFWTFAPGTPFLPLGRPLRASPQGCLRLSFF